MPLGVTSLLSAKQVRQWYSLLTMIKDEDLHTKQLGCVYIISMILKYLHV